MSLENPILQFLSTPAGQILFILCVIAVLFTLLWLGNKIVELARMAGYKSGYDAGYHAAAQAFNEEIAAVRSENAELKAPDHDRGKGTALLTANGHHDSHDVHALYVGMGGDPNRLP